MKSNKSKLVVLVLVILIVYSLGIINYAVAEDDLESVLTLEEISRNLTSSDIIDENLTIRQFASNMKNLTHEDGYDYDLFGYHIKDQIEKVIPLQYFYTEGVHVYTGEEYGFVVITYSVEDLEYNYANSFMIIDFNLVNKKSTQTQDQGSPIENKFVYTIEPILEGFSKTNYIETTEELEIVFPDIQPSSYIGLTNIGINTFIENENEINSYDEGYNAESDTGDVFYSAGLEYKVIESITTEINLESLVNLVIDFGAGKLEAVPFWGNLVSFVDNAVEFAENASNLFDEKIGFETTVGTHNPLQWDNHSKTDQYKQYKEYVRDIYFSQGTTEDESKAFLCASKTDENNCFMSFDVETEGIKANSRIGFISSFSVFYKSEFQEYTVTSSNNQLILSDSMIAGNVPAQFTREDSRKIHLKDSEIITDSNKSAYLLDKDGYNIFTFKPQSEDSDEANKQDLFGTYRFYANQKTGQLPGIRMYVFKSKVNGVPLDVKALCKMPKEDILSITSPFYPYLFATHNTSELNAPNYMDVNFVNDQSTDNTYYVLYTYSFDYLGSPTDFYVSYDYRPPQITKGTDSSQFNLTNEQSAYYMFTPTNRGNYTFTISDSQVANVSIYKNQILGQPLSINLNTNSFDVLLENNETYYFKVTNNTPIKDAYGADNAIVTISGSVLINDGDCFTPISVSDGNQDYIVNHQVSTTILAGKSRIYKVEPKGYSGIYALQNSGYTVDWYDDSFNLLDQAFLTAGETYYVEITTNTTVTDTLTIKYLSEEIAFNGSLQVVTNGDKRFYAYVLNATGDNLNNATVNVSTKLNTTEIHNETFVGQKTIVIDLTPIVFASNNTFITTIIIDEDTYNTREVITSIIMTNVTAGNAISGEYVNLQFSQSYSNVVQINVPSTVKVLILNNTTGSLVSTTGFYFNIASSSDPLIIYRKTGEGNLNIKAPSNQNAITSSRDLIFNVNAPLSITGGAGVENGAGSNNDGKSAIVTNSNNTVVLNGTARLTFLGGTGGNISGRSFYYSDPAGMGGIALQVGNLVINCGTLTIRGGVGGNGGVGVSGTKGADGVGYQADGRGANGADGTDGGYGGDGGTAGMGLVILGSKCVIYTSNITIKAGKAGDGGKGGAGGAGGAGAPGMSVSGFSGQTAGGDGGNGGRGGTGGDAGLRVPAVNSSDMSKIINNTGVDFTSMFTALGDSGGIGLGGTGGEGGAGGSGGTAWFWQEASDGVAGENGANGSNGIWP